ncbi:secondary thiamine-phosphate synthase enzyme YjbQ [Sulfobacillus thermosulfidooxidans]|uniref:secondary thiamine-phosphate synthase enzyme YjbQ n=1 Tax=Sulfobacillus thermosulfidooxidans TaxID=28034 RepID=UPI0002ED3E98|nr:secondary thiamine-phosphate synthase enzyme YjbQ [Sulfobacillus thermosulfidooxidans]
MHRLSLNTHQKMEMLDITPMVRQVVAQEGIQEGIVVIYSPHTTAAITVNENWDADVVHDVLLFLRQTVPSRYPGFRHQEGNSDSHIMVNLMGSSATVIIEQGELMLGQWQGIFFCEFDGPRQRQFWVQLVGQ